MVAIKCTGKPLMCFMGKKELKNQPLIKNWPEKIEEKTLKVA